MTGHEQLVLDLPHRPALGAEDFIVSDSNAAAVAMVDRWPDWPGAAVLLVGPKGSGKTHLANVWQRRTGAARVIAGNADEAALMALAETGCGVVEDLDQGITDEKALFHLLNLARENRFHLLMTARTHPGHWDVGLPDLRSRLRSLAIALIDAPDENLLRAVLVKLLSDRQLPATPHAVNHLVRHMDRTTEMALALAREVDRLLWEKPRHVTRDVARQALERVRAGAESDEALRG